MNKKIILMITLLCATHASIQAMGEFKDRLFNGSHAAEYAELPHVYVDQQNDSLTTHSSEPSDASKVFDSQFLFTMYRVINVAVLVAGIITISTGSCSASESDLYCVASAFTVGGPSSIILWDLGLKLFSHE